MPLLAHSARPKRGISAQSYFDHSSSVARRSIWNAARAFRWRTGDLKNALEALRAAGLYHDLGKLDSENQSVLTSSASRGLPFPHEDAGGKQLLDLGHRFASLLVYAHHAGLPNLVLLKQRGLALFREPLAARQPGLIARTDERLQEYLASHRRSLAGEVSRPESVFNFGSSLTARISLSCLVDADHTDTALNYGERTISEIPATRWGERLESLNGYVRELARESKSDKYRDTLRQMLYESCRDYDAQESICACDSGVGSGKTTAVMAHLLSVARKRRLRHVFVVLPYTNIINQSVKTYRKSLVLDDETQVADQVIAAHHHQADYASVEARQFATLWNSPITVTTAVQFFETLASNNPARLRKLHQLPGSAIFLDEAHAAIPPALWRVTFPWLLELARDWGCHIILASGSLCRFWELADVVGTKTVSIPNIAPKELRNEGDESESRRVKYRREPQALTLDGLTDFVRGTLKAPRLVIFNTKRAAALFARHLREEHRLDVLHLSTALAPVHREKIVEDITSRLLNERQRDWTLVATSCVEAGVDFNFGSAARESCGVLSLLQTAGRANRHSLETNCEVWDFRLDSSLPQHPSFDASRRVLARLFDDDSINTLNATELATLAMRRELGETDIGLKSKQLAEQESAKNFFTVNADYHVISEDTVPVIVDPDLVARLEAREPVLPKEIVRNSVQIYRREIEKLRVPKINRFGQDLYRWNLDYDAAFLGCMQGLLKVDYIQAGGFLGG